MKLVMVVMLFVCSLALGAVRESVAGRQLDKNGGIIVMPMKPHYVMPRERLTWNHSKEFRRAEKSGNLNRDRYEQHFGSMDNRRYTVR